MKKVNSYSSGVTMTGSAPSDCVLRDLIHPAHADALKAHSALAMKLLKTGKNSTRSLYIYIDKAKETGSLSCWVIDDFRVYIRALISIYILSVYICSYITDNMYNWITSAASYTAAYYIYRNNVSIIFANVYYILNLILKKLCPYY